MYQFNPIDGAPVNGGFTQLDYPIRQISVLQPGTDFLRGILLLDRNNAVHSFPESAAENVNIYLTLIDVTFEKKSKCSSSTQILSFFRLMGHSHMYQILILVS